MYSNSDGLKALVRKITSGYLIERDSSKEATITLYGYIPLDVLEEGLLGIEDYKNEIGKSGKIETHFKVPLE